jgi:hypothetical protein
MKKPIIMFMFLLLGIIFMPGFAAIYPSSTLLEGTISDASTSDLIQGVQVTAVTINNYSPGIFRTAYTDSSGHYSIPNIVPGNTQITAFKAGYSLSMATVNVPSSQTTVNDISLQPLTPPQEGAINGTISDISTGEPLKNANIIVLLPGRVTYFAATDSTGYYQLLHLPITEVNLFIKKYGYAPVCDTVTTVASSTVTFDAALTPIEIPEIGAVEGTVQNGNTGDPLAGAMIYVTSSQASTTLCGAACFDGNMKQVTFTDSTGHYILPRLYSGNYELTASLKGFDSESQSIEIIGNSTTITDFSLTPEALPYGSATGTISDASTGEPIIGAFVFAAVPPDHWYMNLRHLWTRTDTTGFYQLDRIPFGTQTIKAFRFGYYPGEMGVEILSGETSACNIQLTPIPLPARGTLLGTVTDASTGLPIENARVIVPAYRDISICGPYSAYNTYTDASGFYALDSIPIGGRLVISCKSSYYHQVKNVMILANSTSTVDFELVPYENATTAMTVTVRDLNTGEYIPGATVFLPVIPELIPLSAWDINWNNTNAAGQARISTLPPGEAFIVAGKEGYESVISPLTINPGHQGITIYLKATSLTAVENWQLF